MTQKKQDIGFEAKLEALEALANTMEEGGLSLEALMQAYEKGIRISQELTKELETAQGKLMSLKDGALKPVEDHDGL